VHALGLARQLHLTTSHAEEDLEAKSRKRIALHVDEVLSPIDRVQESLGVEC
jgi:hypothetical protein